jgi:hypothetical protein
MGDAEATQKIGLKGGVCGTDSGGKTFLISSEGGALLIQAAISYAETTCGEGDGAVGLEAMGEGESDFELEERVGVFTMIEVELGGFAADFKEV